MHYLSVFMVFIIVFGERKASLEPIFHCFIRAWSNSPENEALAMYILNDQELEALHRLSVFKGLHSFRRRNAPLLKSILH